ncbi:hypothetical protein KKC63_01110 [Patescibacteria group bacterium]|nr:hypothetical protein [Patescibacteria group bacterium]MBU4023039.1 hypothetical protein [Patescibacteria group bacterium]
MKEKEIAELQRMLAPHIGKRVSVTHKVSGRAHSTVSARLSTVTYKFVQVGSEIIHLADIRELSLVVISGGEVSMPEDLVPK